MLDVELDADDTDAPRGGVGEAFERLGGADLVLLAVGLLGERGGLPDDSTARSTCCASTSSARARCCCTRRATLRDQRHGHARSCSPRSPASGCGPANVVYGAAKAGLDALAQGLGDALHAGGVRVMVVRPGFVHTADDARARRPSARDRSGAVARAVVRGLERGDTVVWVPGSLRWMMLVLRLLPRADLPAAAAVSFSEPNGRTGDDPATALPPGAERQARRRELRRRRGLRRLDVAIGVLLAIVALLLAPGVAVVAIGAVIVLLACGLSLLYGAPARSPGALASRRRPHATPRLALPLGLLGTIWRRFGLDRPDPARPRGYSSTGDHERRR